MKHEYALDFAPPFVGLDNELYNTFRLDTSWSKRLAKGDEVYIQSSKDKLIFSKACVEDVIVGQIGELMLLHAHNNHNELGQDDGRSAERLYKTMQKMYGPQVLNSPRKKATVIYLRKIE